MPLQLSEKLDEVARLNDRSKSQEIIHTLKQVHLPEGVE
ncbi:Arc-like DNA binding domain protein [Leptospira licerasiae serovar Varillal str. VAR 010]|nr:Arc-like DNA binding domain protein [Leptospira licerasiae serovar Varillal str. VAR 010]